MTNFLKAAMSTGLVLLLGLTASAQSGSQDDKANGQKSEKSDSKKSETSNGQKDEKSDGQTKGDKHQGSGQVERIRGELAAVSVVGETMVNYNTGRGVVAEFSYLTILGSPAGGKGGQGDSKQPDQGHASKAEKKDQGSGQGEANKGQDHSGSASMSRRNVYEIAIGPDTQVRSRGSQGEKPQGSARERSQSSLGQLELGDRVLVEFERLSDQAKPGPGGEAQGASANQSRHGRHRIVRGLAKTLTILPSPDGGDQKGSQGKTDGDSPEKGQSGSDTGQKKSDQDK